jgi:hypothetical protein
MAEEVTTSTFGIRLESISAPLAFELWFEGSLFYYRDRHNRWTVDRILQGNWYTLDSGNSSLGDGIEAGIYRILKAAPEIAKAIYEDYPL